MKSFFTFLILVLFLILISFAIFWLGVYLPKDATSQTEKSFLIKKGEGTREIAFNLEKQGLIRWAPVFRIYTLSKGISGKLQSGTYLLSPSMTVPEIVEKLVKGEIIEEKITIIEGWNLRNIGWYFENKGIFQAEEFFELVGFPLVDYSKAINLPKPKDFSAEFACPVGSLQGDSCGDFLKDKPKNLSLEGYLFPDTYQVQKGESLENIIRQMLHNFDKKLTLDLRSEISRQEKSIFEIITMASLIEKEVQTLEDKKLVSGILWKRLEAAMLLQVDASIAYITGEQTTKISIEETKIDSPYNTYKYQGLPLGPICNPGLESIQASIYPESSKYWFYLSTPEGETIFSKTLEEHNTARAKYLYNNSK